MTETKDELEQLLEREMELWDPGANMALPLGVLPDPDGHRVTTNRFLSESDCWEYRDRFRACIVQICYCPQKTTIEESSSVATVLGATAVVIRRGDGSIIDWWSVDNG